MDPLASSVDMDLKIHTSRLANATCSVKTVLTRPQSDDILVQPVLLHGTQDFVRCDTLC